MEKVIEILNRQGRFYAIKKEPGFNQVDVVTKYLDCEVLIAACKSLRFMSCGTNGENEM